MPLMPSLSPLSDPSATTEGILLSKALSEYDGILSGHPAASATDH